MKYNIYNVPKVIALDQFRMVKNISQSINESEDNFLNDEKNILFWQKTTKQLKQLRLILISMSLYCQQFKIKNQKIDHDSGDDIWNELIDELSNCDRLLIQLCFSSWFNTNSNKKLNSNKVFNKFFNYLKSVNPNLINNCSKTINQLDEAVINTQQIENGLISNRINPISFSKALNKIKTENKISSNLLNSWNNLYSTANYLRKKINSNKESEKKAVITIVN